jgi:hypothetical protein
MQLVIMVVGGVHDRTNQYGLINFTQTCQRVQHINCCIFGVRAWCGYRSSDQSCNGLANGGIHKYSSYDRVKEVIKEYEKEKLEKEKIGSISRKRRRTDDTTTADTTTTEAPQKRTAFSDEEDSEI